MFNVFRKHRLCRLSVMTADGSVQGKVVTCSVRVAHWACLVGSRVCARSHALAHTCRDAALITVIHRDHIAPGTSCCVSVVHALSFLITPRGTLCILIPLQMFGNEEKGTFHGQTIYLSQPAYLLVTRSSLKSL